MSLGSTARSPRSTALSASAGAVLTLGAFAVVLAASVLAPLVLLALLAGALLLHLALRPRAAEATDGQGPSDPSDRSGRLGDAGRAAAPLRVRGPMTRTMTRSLPRIADGTDEGILSAIPEGICRTFRVLPYAAIDDHVLVAAADPDDPMTEQLVAERFDRPVILVRHTVSEISDAVDGVYPPEENVTETPEARRARMQMAQMLTRAGLVSREDLQRGMLEYAHTGDPLGDILVAQGSLSEDVLVAALSELHQLQRVGLVGFEPDHDVARMLPEALARTLQAVPVAVVDGEVLLAVARPLGATRSDDVEAALGRPFRQLLANRSDLDRLVQRIHRHHYTEEATGGLATARPDASAQVAVSAGQRVVAVGLLVAVAVCAVAWPAGTGITLVTLAALGYACVAAYRLLLTMRAFGRRLGARVSDADVARLDERTLPVYTVLVPLREEADAVERLVRDLDALDYPRTRLDLRLLCEEDDVETVEAVRALDLPPHYHLVLVPGSHPRTRPKALDYGLQLATGAFTVVYDAEDRPDPDQLKRAVVAFGRAPADVVCLQARVNHHDQDHGLLTAWSSSEHAALFELQLPATEAAGSPLPLGGGSCHFPTSALRELGAWDPYHVTAGTDLGLRLHREGYRAAILDSTTLEAAPPDLAGWLRQRSRRSTGDLQTWLVHTRHPLRLLRQVGVKDFVAVNLTVGSTFALLVNPVFWVLATLDVLTRSSAVDVIDPSPVFTLATCMLLLGNGAFVYAAVAGSIHRGDFGLTRTAVLMPVYWGLMSLAAWWGLLQLLTQPFLREKTEHGPGER